MSMSRLSDLARSKWRWNMPRRQGRLFYVRASRRRVAGAERYAPNLWPVWIVVPATILVVLCFFWWIYNLLRRVAPLVDLRTASGGHRFGVNTIDVLKSAVTVLGLIGAVLAGIYAYRKQRISESDALRADGEQLARRYVTAAEQLGHEQAAVRLAGVFGMSRLADDWVEHRQVCIDVLCAYVRIPYEVNEVSERYRHGEKVVRLAVIEVIRRHLLNDGLTPYWGLNSFDFRGAVLDGGSFRGIDLSKGTLDLHEARLVSGVLDFRDSTFSTSSTHFESIHVSGGIIDFTGASFIESCLDFSYLQLEGGAIRISEVTIDRANLLFLKANLSAGRLELDKLLLVDGCIDFERARISGADIDFRQAKLYGGRLNLSRVEVLAGNIYFGRAELMAGEIWLDEANISGGLLDFSSVIMGGTIIRRDGGYFSDRAVHWWHTNID
jgi:uncharacterized protein YjbI with pentapeptide repeats